MELKKLKIHNYQCFGPEEKEIIINDFTTLIGANNSGKTATLKALEKLFGVSRKSRMLKRSDFHIPKGKTIESFDNLYLSIEAVFDFPSLNEQEKEENFNDEIAAFF